jgi:tetratricopeptide (TPR) repeat protein
VKRWLAVAIFLAVSFTALAQAPSDKTSSDFETRRKQADALHQLGRDVDALPLYEELSKEKPNDIGLLESYGMCVIAKSATVKDPQEQKQLRVQARQILLRSRELGSTSQLSEMANDIPPDGSIPAFSDHKDVDDAMQAGEAAFAKGDYDIAISSYEKALALDPKNYTTALFIGDAYFRKGDGDNAGVWFSQAIAIDPNGETAYRYWGDALMKQGKYEQAESKYISAIIAYPYDRKTWHGLVNWANARNKQIVFPRIVPPSKVEDTAKGATITIDPSSLAQGKDDPAAAAWLVYPMTHVNWKNEGKFQKQYPNEKTYRHSLAEEVDAFSVVLKVYGELTAKKKPPQIDPQIGKLQELQSNGYLESYILLNRADQGIAQDYPAYRDAHRAVLQDYLESCIVAK